MTQAELLSANDALFTTNGTNDIEGIEVNGFVYDLITSIWAAFGNAADVKLNLKGYVNFADETARTILKGDVFINSPIDEAVPAGTFAGDWIVCLDSGADFTEITPGETNSIWFYFPFGKLNDPATIQTLLEAFNPFTEINMDGSELTLNDVTSKNVWYLNESHGVGINIATFGAGTAGQNKKLWLKLAADDIYTMNCTALGSAGIFIVGIAAGSTKTFTGSLKTNYILDVVCLASNQWLVTSIYS